MGVIWDPIRIHETIAFVATGVRAFFVREIVVEAEELYAAW